MDKDTIQGVKDLGLLFIGLGGFALAALTQWWAYKGRTSYFRQKIYEKQIEAYQAMMESLTKVGDRVIGFVLAFSRLSPEEKENEYGEFVRAFDTHRIIAGRTFAFLPKDVLMAIMNYETILNELMADPTRDPGMDKYTDGLGLLMRQIRAHLGTEPLTAEIVSHFVFPKRPSANKA